MAIVTEVDSDFADRADAVDVVERGLRLRHGICMAATQMYLV